MSTLLNNKILKIIPIIFFIVITLRIAYSYADIKNRENEFAKQEAKVLYDYVSANRDYYRKLFDEATLPLDSNTIHVLPAFSSHIISQDFSKRNPLNITVRTVSNNARNMANTANKDELQAIKFFNDNKNEQEYFSKQNSEYYQYANVLKVDATCLRCHGKKEDAPKLIQDNYATAYDYKIGEVRGIVSINIPTKNLEKYFLKDFFYAIFYDIVLFISLFLGIYYLLSKSKKLNTALELKVEEKADQLKNSLLFERLTHLPNRLKLIEDIALNNNSDFLHLALINIDSFKDINDLYGFKVGDDILKQIAQKIKKFCILNDSVYKLPNDNYAIFTTMKISQDEFVQKIKNIIHSIQESKFKAYDHEVFIRLSCGIASNENSLMIKANIALQIAKSKAKDLIVYDNSLDTKEQIAVNNNAILILKEAIKEDRITPYFQPIYNTRTKKIEKYESLARIVLKSGEVIAPIYFLDIAIKTKLYPEITKAMIRKSFDYFKDKDFVFSINLSIHDIQDKKTLKYITDKLEEFSEPSRVIFEIVESDKIEDYQELKKFIQDMKKYGCKIAIDDFGSGYSNFSHLFELHADFLKIDSSLVRFITTDYNSRIIVKTIISFASDLGLKTIAEFVEDKESLDLLQEMGVDFIQGYYIGKPGSKLKKGYD